MTELQPKKQRYYAMRKMLHRVSKKVLDKRVTPHILRHSSVTYYANLIKNPYKLCYRYGWSMSSKMIDRYLDREGIFEQEIPEIVKTRDISKLEKQNQVLREELTLVKESNTELRAEVEKVKKELAGLFEGKNFMKLLMALAENQRKMCKALKETISKKFDFVLPTLQFKKFNSGMNQVRRRKFLKY